MKRTLAFVLIAALAGAAVVFLSQKRQTPALAESGVARSLAESRATRVSKLSYEVSLVVPPAIQTPITGRIIASFTLKDATAPLVFDFAQPPDHLKATLVNGRAVTPDLANGHITLAESVFAAGDNSVQFDFVAGDAPFNRNDEFVYTLFVPARASIAMPCFDQPDLKARWTLALEIPPGWTAVANGAETGRISGAGRLSLIFSQTQPLSTYVFGFAAGKFSIETAQRDGRTFRMFHRETDAAKVARNRDAVFDLHARALAWLESYTGITYPFGKFDFVLIPSFQFGGMEHAGAIDYNASALLLDASATQTQLLYRANTIAHETSHMWFGDLVTMRWFNDVWMKEVFANFMAAKIVNPSFPEVNHELRFLVQNYPAAYDVDRTEGANPIRQNLANLNEAGSLYGAIIYQKAPIVMRQLELLVGPDAFRSGLREYLNRFRFTNATWLDLIDMLDAKTPADLSAWSHHWVEEPGRPTIRTDVQVSGGRIASLKFLAGVGPDALVRPQQLRVLIGSGAAPVKSIDVTLREPSTSIPEAVGLPSPDWVLPVGGGLGYGFFDLDPRTLEFLSASLETLADPLTRGAAVVAMWECVLEGRVAPARWFETLLTAVPHEPNELVVGQMLSQLRQIYWRFTTPSGRAPLAARLDATLRAGLAHAASTSLKGAWFAAIRAMATTPETLSWLEQVWEREIRIEGLPLAEPDEADLAMDLALRGVARSGEILDAELARLTNPDRQARFRFIRPALAADQATRDAFFENLKDVANRRHEAWVLDAMRYLNHPLRADASAKYLVPALGLVREIQRTGDIFFPKNWADAALSGSQSPDAAATVRAFIKDLPADYPPRLRWVLLSAADPLFRAAKLTAAR